MLMLCRLVASCFPSSSTMKARTDAMGILLQHAEGGK